MEAQEKAPLELALNSVWASSLLPWGVRERACFKELIGVSWADKEQIVSRGNHLAKTKEREGIWSVCKTASPYLGLEPKGSVGEWCRVMLERPAGPSHRGLGSILRILDFSFKMVKHH